MLPGKSPVDVIKSKKKDQLSLLRPVRAGEGGSARGGGGANERREAAPKFDNRRRAAAKILKTKVLTRQAVSVSKGLGKQSLSAKG